MTEAPKARDWLTELTEIGDGETFLRAVGEVAAVRSDLCDAVCEIAQRGWAEEFVQKVRTVFETKAKARAENIAYMEEGRRARERLAAGAIAEMEAKRAALLQPKPLPKPEAEAPAQPEPVPAGRALVPANHGGAIRFGREETKIFSSPTQPERADPEARATGRTTGRSWQRASSRGG